jgi:PAS domain S-box-containing protein
MKVNILDLIDFKRVNVLLEGFNKTTGFVTAILDLDGNVLSQSGWRHICTAFHRVHPGTSGRCTISDTVLAGSLAEGEKYHFYKCLNGLVDVAVPIVINGDHVANLFSGQFFFEEPDRTFFRAQAAKYGFDEDGYMGALEAVPVVSEERVKTAMEFLLNMTQLITETTFHRLEQVELNEAIRESERHLRNSQQIARLGSWRLDVASNEVKWTEQLYHMYGFDPTLPPPPYTEHMKLFTPESWERLSTSLAQTRETGIPYELELETVRKDGSRGWMWVRGEAVKGADGHTTALWGAALDITERKGVEEALRHQAEALRASNTELELFNRAMVGRELRMIELKQEINELCRRLGEPPRHATDELRTE